MKVPLDKTFICPGCGKEFEKRAVNHIRCYLCAAKRDRERNLTYKESKKEIQKK
jgi:DNA-directed RNA polymerase subunit RPC12/RpoP